MPARTTTRQLETTARVFHALSDPTRLNLVALLRGGEQCVCDLTDALEAGQSRLSFHLKPLKEAGILRDRRQGRWGYDALDPHVAAEPLQFVASITAARGGLRLAKSAR